MSYDPDFADIERRHEQAPDEPYAGDLEVCPECGSDNFKSYKMDLRVVEGGEYECQVCGKVWG